MVKKDQLCAIALKKRNKILKGLFTQNSCYGNQLTLILPSLLRLVFTSDGVVVGVVIRSVERYDQVKIKLTESEAKHRF